uniref:Integral membrane protein 2 n=1 Tax=Echinostoma caproni TaxID=27848 RepID=A0A183B7G8_9TREM
LRPPVGSEVYGRPSLQFRPFSGIGSGPVVHNQRRRRLLLIYVLCVLITLAIVAGLLFAMFVLNFGPFATHTAHGFGPRSMCRVFSPLLRTSWVESLSADDNVLNVTLTDMPRSHTYWILHLCTAFLTVIRTEDRCFIRPMRDEMVQACARGYLKLVHDGQALPDSVEAKIRDEFWFTEPPSSTPKVIRNSLIMAWCEGVPAFRLVSRPPPSDFANGSPNTVSDILCDQGVFPPVHITD